MPGQGQVSRGHVSGSLLQAQSTAPAFGKCSLLLSSLPFSPSRFRQPVLPWAGLTCHSCHLGPSPPILRSPSKEKPRICVQSPGHHGHGEPIVVDFAHSGPVGRHLMLLCLIYNLKLFWKKLPRNRLPEWGKM